MPAAETETAPSFLRFTAIQGIERKQDLVNVAPKGCFISTEANANAFSTRATKFFASIIFLLGQTPISPIF